MSSSTMFPLVNLIPKRETGAYDFLRKFPDFDGRGIKMCIMDSGVDPGAAGLQVTTNGLPKILDIMDASGAGDIDTSTVVELGADGQLTGITGKKLKIPPAWKSTDGKYHLGLVKLFNIVAEDYHGDWKSARKEEKWTAQHGTLLSGVMNSELTSADTGIKEDVDVQLDVLKSLEDKYEDLGPVYDLVVFNDGKTWWAAMDVTESGDFSDAMLLTNYRDQLKYATIGGIYQLNFTMNIHEDGNRVEVVIPQEHGTHVACIAAGNFTEQPEKNGLAPGCQIVSIKIGHTSLDGSNETGTALVRAFLYCMKNGIDIVNISYNEPYNWSDGGRVFDAIKMAVLEYGIVVCVAAGNAGPGLTTVGSLPASHFTLGIGAYVTPEMMKDLYGLTRSHPALMYNWTSRGPTLDGDTGVNLCAPGGAVASIPTYTLKNSSLFNGTSMACPNACGSIALVLSGLRAEKLKWSPFSVQRAFENTAKRIDDSADSALSQGAGLISCGAAYEWLCKYGNSVEEQVDFQICCDGGGGIYLRNPHQLIDANHTVTIDVVLPKKPELFAEMAKLTLPVLLASPADWVRTPEAVALSTGKKSFRIELRCASLRPGVHHTTLNGYRSGQLDKGPIFKVPITVCIPYYTAQWTIAEKEMRCKPGQPMRQFVQVPQGATFAEWRIELDGYEGGDLPKDLAPVMNFEYHAMQLARNAQYKTHMFREAQTLPLKRVVSCVFPVSDRLGLLELSVALFWNRVSTAVLNWSLDFHGLKPTVPEIVHLEGESYYRVDVDCGSRAEYFAPSTMFSHLVQPLRPTECTMSPLGERDSWPDGRITYQSILQYQFKLDKPATVEPTCPLLMDFLYENEIEGQMWKLYDSNKRLLKTGEARVMRKIDFTAKLPKGEYLIQLQLRHDNRKVLERLQDAVVHLRKKLASPPTCDVVKSYLSALRDCSDKYRSAILAPHQSDFFFLVPPSTEKIGKGLHGSYFMEGWLYFSLGKDQPADSRRNAGAYRLKYVLTEPSSTKKNPPKNQNKVAEDNPDDPVFLHQIALLDKLADFKKKSDYLTSLAAETRGPLQLLKLRYTYLVALSKLNETNATLEVSSAIQATADAIVQSVDQRDLLAAIGSQAEALQDEEKQYLELRKAAVSEALYQRCMALLKPSEGTSVTDGQVDTAVKELFKFLDPKSDTRFAEVSYYHNLRKKNYGKAFKFALHVAEEKPSMVKYKEVVETAIKLKWTHVAHYFTDRLPVLFPAKHELF